LDITFRKTYLIRISRKAEESLSASSDVQGSLELRNRRYFPRPLFIAQSVQTIKFLKKTEDLAGNEANQKLKLAYDSIIAY